MKVFKIIINIYIMNSEHLNEILPRLFLGNYHAAKTHHDKFDLVINCTRDFPSHHDNTIRIPIDDIIADDDTLYQLIQTTNILDIIFSEHNKGKKILVHCFAGVSRSATIVACFLLKFGKKQDNSLLRVSDVLNFLKSKRPIVFQFGLSFKNTLNKYELMNYPDN